VVNRALGRAAACVVVAACLVGGWTSTAPAAKSLKVVAGGGIDPIYCDSNDADGFYGFAIEQSTSGTTTEYTNCSDNEVLEYDWSGQYPGGGAYPIAGITHADALAWDGGRHALWVCADGTRVGTFTPTYPDSAPFVQHFVSAGCATALAYDAVDDTLFTSDGSGVVQHWTAGGTLLASTDITAQLGGSHVRSMTYGGLLFVSTDSGDVYSLTARLRSPKLLGNVGSDVIDLECDDAGPSDVLFVAKSATTPSGYRTSSFTGYGVKDGTCRTGGGNKPDIRPVAELAPTPDTGPAPLTVALDASGSHDPDGTIGSYSFAHGEILPDWDQLGQQTSPIATWTYETPGVFYPGVSVVDDLGLWGAAGAGGRVIVTSSQPCVPGGRPAAAATSLISRLSYRAALFEIDVDTTNPGCSDDTVRSVQFQLPPGASLGEGYTQLDGRPYTTDAHPNAHGVVRFRTPFTSHADGAMSRIRIFLKVDAPGTYVFGGTVTLGDGTKVAIAPRTITATP
jgi:hypothetical protein